MSNGIHVFYGDGIGKTSAAIGQCIKESSLGNKVIVIQYLKGKGIDEFSALEKMEPEIKLFRFERSNEKFCDLSEECKKEERMNILNGFNFAKKVVETGECDLLVLDEILGLIDYGIITEEDIVNLIKLRSDEHRIILTGKNMPARLKEHVETISRIDQEK